MPTKCICSMTVFQALIHDSQMEYIKVSSSYFSLSCSSSSLHLEKEADPVAGLLRMMSLTVRKNSCDKEQGCVMSIFLMFHQICYFGVAII